MKKNKSTNLFNRCVELLSIIKNKYSHSINIKNIEIKILKNLNGYIAARKNISKNGIIISLTNSIFLSNVLRPKFSKDINTLAINNVNFKDIAIILQGPYITKDDFTFHTLQIYNKLYYNCLKILSVWEGDLSIKEKQKLKLIHNLKIIENKPLLNNGKFNIDAQMYSTNQAINFAKKNGLEYITKTRTDCRIYSANAISYCFSLCNFYPKNKIISLDFTNKHLIYSLSDVFQFGHINEMSKFWNFEEYKKGINNYFKGRDLINDTPVVAEIFLTARYLVSIGEKLNWTLDCWIDKLINNFIIIDRSSIDFFLNKYEYEFEQRYFTAYNSPFAQGLSHSDWFCLFNDKQKNIIKYYTDEKYRIKWTKKNNEFKKIK